MPFTVTISFNTHIIHSSQLGRFRTLKKESSGFYRGLPNDTELCDSQLTYNHVSLIMHMQH